VDALLADRSQAMDLINEGAIGEVRMIQSDFGFRTEVNPSGRLFDRKSGGWRFARCRRLLCVVIGHDPW
jgi:hypothetical protein